MRSKKTFKMPPPPDREVGQYGQFKLLQTSDGKHYVAGGSEMGRIIVKNWCKRLDPSLKFTETKAVQSVSTKSSPVTLKFYFK